jgi:hypothetical protein
MFSTSFFLKFHLIYLCTLTVQFAVHHTPSGGPGKNYYGLHATMDVYGHKLIPGQESSTGIWLNHDGDGVVSSLNAISVGWHVCIFFSF